MVWGYSCANRIIILIKETTYISRFNRTNPLNTKRTRVVFCLRFVEWHLLFKYTFWWIQLQFTSSARFKYKIYTTFQCFIWVFIRFSEMRIEKIVYNIVVKLLCFTSKLNISHPSPNWNVFTVKLFREM